MLKRCLNCNLEKPYSDFGKHKGRKNGLADRCKDCRNRKAVLNRHNITQLQKDSMLIAQNFMCAICQIHQDSLNHILAVDHCHKTGNIRGLLCPECNLGLGKFKDSVSILESAINYLIKTINKGENNEKL